MLLLTVPRLMLTRQSLLRAGGASSSFRTKTLAMRQLAQRSLSTTPIRLQASAAVAQATTAAVATTTPSATAAPAAAADVSSVVGASAGQTPPLESALNAVAATTVDATSVPVVDELTLSQLADGLSSDLIIAAGGSPTLADLGLGGWTPSGLVQTLLDTIQSAGLPWWATIACATITMKLVLFPLIIKGQRHTIKVNNHMPEMQEFQQRMSEARLSGNELEQTKLTAEFKAFTDLHSINPFKGFIPPLVQAPVFISFFFALRGMANLPLESMKTGGLWWFTDLTVPDPYYLLPVATSLTLLATIELGAEGGIRMDNIQWARYVIRALPVVMFPFMMHFPSAVLCYWLTSNLFTLGQVALLRVESIRQRLDIPKLIVHPKQKLALSKKPFMESFQDSFDNSKMMRELEQRKRADEIRFRRAGTAPLVKTYKHDPTKIKSKVAVQAKEHSG